MQTALNFTGQWWPSAAPDLLLDVVNPATGQIVARTPIGDPVDVSAAVGAAAAAFPGWRRTPPQERIQYLFRLRALLAEQIDDVARTIVIENGKTLAEAKAELQRGLENIEVACGIPRASPLRATFLITHAAQIVPPELTGRIEPTRLEGINLRGVFRFPLERYAGQILPSQTAAKTSART